MQIVHVRECRTACQAAPLPRVDAAPKLSAAVGRTQTASQQLARRWYTPRPVMIRAISD